MNGISSRGAKRAGLLALLAVISACTLTAPERVSLEPPVQPGDLGAESCQKALTRVEAAVLQQGTQPAYPHTLAAFPYLAITRFWASYAGDLPGEAGREAWLEQLQVLGKQVRESAWSTLNPAPDQELRAFLERCLARQLELDRQQPAFWDNLQRAVRVPDNYGRLPRLFGLYPLTREFVLQGYQRWRAAWPPLEAPLPWHPVTWVLYEPVADPVEEARAMELAQQLRAARRSHPLGVPQLSSRAEAQLFERYQPRFLVATDSESDRIGRVVASPAGARIDIARPVHYRWIGYARFGQQVLLQLHYAVWFPRRPSENRPDLYAGRFDGLIWRVSLDDRGSVLAFDSIHSCGCYHKLYPVAGGALLRPLDEREEQPQRFPLLPAGRERPIVVVQSSNHFIRHVGDWVPAQVERLPLPGLPYEQLYRLPIEDGARSISLFDARGLVPGSQRLERFLLWPMGIASPGAMRSRGVQAVRFTGRRHFDEPRLLEQFFWVRPPQAANGRKENAANTDRTR